MRLTRFLFACWMGALVGCGSAPPADCPVALDLPGAYRCAGACVGADGVVMQVSGEEDVIDALDASAGLFRVQITGAGGFSETEIGALQGDVLYTGTARVSDERYPVVEEYHFTTDPACRAVGYTKIVRGLNPEAFKACSIRCTRG
jgi:hypothetical protein